MLTVYLCNRKKHWKRTRERTEIAARTLETAPDIALVMTAEAAEAVAKTPRTRMKRNTESS